MSFHPLQFPVFQNIILNCFEKLWQTSLSPFNIFTVLVTSFFLNFPKKIWLTESGSCSITGRNGRSLAMLSSNGFSIPHWHEIYTKMYEVEISLQSKEFLSMCLSFASPTGLDGSNLSILAVCHRSGWSTAEPAALCSGDLNIGIECMLVARCSNYKTHNISVLGLWDVLREFSSPNSLDNG